MSNKYNGFSLVELMVAVAIIGILASISYPQYLRYQIKSKKVEGKLRLAEVKLAQMSWFAQYETFASCLNLMGIQRVPNSYYSVGFAIDASNGGDPSSPNGISVANGAPTSCLTDTDESTFFFPGFKAVGIATAPTLLQTVSIAGGGGVAISGDAYLVMAHAVLGDHLISKQRSFINSAHAQSVVSSVYGLISIGSINTHFMFESTGEGSLLLDILNTFQNWCRSQPPTGQYFQSGSCATLLRDIRKP